VQLAPLFLLIIFSSENLKNQRGILPLVLLEDLDTALMIDQYLNGGLRTSKIAMLPEQTIFFVVELEKIVCSGNISLARGFPLNPLYT